MQSPGIDATEEPTNDNGRLRRSSSSTSDGDRQESDALLYGISEGEKKDDTEPTWTLMLSLRSLWFLSGISSATWGRFSTVYYQEKGMSREQIGFIEGLMPIVIAGTQPLWGYIADRTRSPRSVFVITRVVSTAILMVLAFPSVASGFERLLCISLVMSLFIPGGILDGFTFDVLGSHGQRLYGRLRLWLALSYGLGSFGMGAVTDRFGFDWNFLLYGVFTLFLLINMGCIHTSPAQKTSLAQRGDFAELTRCVTSVHTVLFFTEVLLFGICMGVVEKGLLFVYLMEDLKASTTLCGAVVGVTAIFELPVFHYSQSIMQCLGFEGAVSLSYFSYMVRVYGYTLLAPESVLWIFALESLHGLTFAVLWIAYVDHAYKITPRGWSSTLQSILCTVYFNVGMGIGAIIGGMIMDHYGAIFMWRCAVGLASLLFTWRLLSLLASQLAKLCSSGEEAARPEAEEPE